MADEKIYIWTGKSGKEYKYWIHPIETPFKADVGNYIFAKETKPNTWAAIYIGETDNLKNRLTPNHEKMPCIKRYGGTHIHAHTGSYTKGIRQAEEADIIEANNPPCNLED
jgi:hypothetical protein